MSNGASFEFGFVEVIKATEKAILVRDTDGEEHWVPQSQIHDDSEVWKEGDDGKLVVTEWIAEQKGWL